MTINKLWLFVALLGCCQLGWSQPSSSQLKPVLNQLSPSDQPELLLLGIDTEAGFQTLLIEINQQKANLLAPLPYLASPQKDGFWYLQSQMIYEYLEADADEEYMEDMSTRCEHLFLAKSPSALQKIRAPYQKLPKEGQEANWSEDGVFKLDWIAPGLISYSMMGGGYYGGAHPAYFGNNGITERFDDFKTCQHYQATSLKTECERKKKGQALKALIPEANWKKAQQIIAAKAEKGEFDDTLDGEPVAGRAAHVEDMEALMRHREGLLYPDYLAYADAMYIESVDYTFLATHKGQTSLKGRGLAFNSLPFDFAKIVKMDAPLLDLYLSPKHNALLLDYGSHIVVLDGKTGQELKRFDLNGRVCMAEWAIGASVERWKGMLLDE